jgi:hypothetical protein
MTVISKTVTAVEVAISFKNPPGYIEMPTMHVIKNNTKIELPNIESFDIFLNKSAYGSSIPTSLGTVNKITIYKNEKSKSSDEMLIENPKYFCAYPPGFTE